MPGRAFIVIAALFGLTGVAAGAFAAHGLEDARAAELLRTGSAYALWHALAMLAYLALRGRSPVPPALLALGTVLFSFSLYALALGAPRGIALVTPVGGLALLAGWVGVGVTALRRGFAGLSERA